MTTATRPGTSVAIQDAAVGNLPASVRERLELRRMANAVAGKLAEMNWGKALDQHTRRAVADWGARFRVDVTTEIEVLGSNIYLNSRFYLRRLAEMIHGGLVEYAYADHVEEDPRLAKMGPEGEGEISRRLRERITHQIPDKAASAVVFRIKLRNMEREVVGAKWCGGGTRAKDPVGDQFPIETSESRAARRAIRQIVSHVPEKAAEIMEVEDAAETMSDRIAEGKEAAKEREAKAPQMSGLPVSSGSPSDPYATDDPAPSRQRSEDDDLLELDEQRFAE